MKFRFYDPDEEEKPVKVNETPKAEEKPQPKVEPSRKQGLVLDWIHELDWNDNPFTMAATPSHSYVSNQDAARQALNMFFIRQYKFGTISAEHGQGASFMLLWIQEELDAYADRFNVYAISASTSAQNLTKQLVAPHEKLFAKYKGTSTADLVTFIKPKLKKQLVLLVDDADDVEALEPLLLVLLRECNAAIILAGVKPKAIATDELKVTLAKLNPKDAVVMLQKRIAAVGGKGIEPFNNKLVEELWKASEHNPGKFLGYCNETAVKLALKHVELPEEPEEMPEKKDSKKSGKKQKDSKTEKESAKDERKKSAYDDLIEGLAK